MTDWYDEYWWADLIRDEITVKHGLFVVDTKSSTTARKATPKEIDKSKQRIKEKVKMFNDRYGGI